MDTFVDSSWYLLRYCDPHNDQAPWDPRLVDFWMPVDLYIGGIDHATGHLLYSRFFVKALNDFGLLGFREPFQAPLPPGLGAPGRYEDVEVEGNVTGPDQLADMYGADAVRTYILFIGPADQDMEWSEEGVEGVARFLRRLWRIVNEVAEQAAEGRGRADRPGPRRPPDDCEGDRRHRSPLPVQHADRGGHGAGERAGARAGGSRRALRGRDRGHADPAVCAAHRRGAVGAARARAAVGAAVASGGPGAAGAGDVRARDPGQRPGARPSRGFGGSSEEELVAQARASARVQEFLDGKEIRKEIVVPGKLVNLVVG